MASTAEIRLIARDDASDTIRRVAAELRRIGSAAPLALPGGGDVGREISNAQAKALAANARLEAARLNSAARVRTTEESSTARVSSAQLAANAKVEAARLRTAAQVEIAEKRIAAASARASSQGPALPRTFAGFTGAGIAQLAGGLGLAVGAQELLAFGLSAGRASIELGRNQSVLRSLAGTTNDYQRILGIARQQQGLFGGSLASNIAGLQGLVVSARASGASLEQLINLSQRLSVLDPSQGLEGARIALSEALAGDPSSLARRYEIPRSALAKIKDETLSVTERLNVLDGFLTKIGITSDTVSGSITEQAKAFNQLSAAWDTLKTTVGGGLTALLTGGGTRFSAAQGLTNILTGGSAQNAGLEGQNQLAFANAGGNFDAYIANTRRINEANRFVIGSFQELSQAQFQFAQGLVQQGVSYDQAVIKAQSLATVNQQLVQNELGHGAILAQNAQRILAVAGINDHYASTIQELNGHRLAGNITDQQYLINLVQLEQAGRQQVATEAAAAAAKQNTVSATEQARQVILEQAQALQTEALESLNSQARTQELGLAKQQLQLQAQNAANALLASGTAGAATAARLAASASGVDQLTAAYFRLAQAQAFASASQAFRNQEIAFKSGQTPRTAAQVQADIAAAKAKRDYEFATANAAGKERILQRELATTKKGSAEYFRLLQQIEALRAGTARQTTPKIPPALSRDTRADLALLNDQQKIARLQQELAKTTNPTRRKEIQAEIVKVQSRIDKTGERAEKQAEAAAKKAAREQERDNEKAARDAEELRRAKFALLSDTEKLAELQARSVNTKLPEVERLEALKQIRDLEQKIADDRERSQRAALDANLLRIRDAQDRLKETRDLEQAKRVLGSADASAEQKQAAQLRIDEINAEQAKRAFDIQDKTKEAGQQIAAEADKLLRGGPAKLPTLSVDGVEQSATALQRAIATEPAVPTTPVPVSLPTVPAGVLQAMQTVVNLSITIDGKDIPFKATSSDNRVLLNALTNAARQSGSVRS